MSLTQSSILPACYAGEGKQAPVSFLRWAICLLGLGAASLHAAWPLGTPTIAAASGLGPDSNPPALFETPIGFKVASPAIPEPGYVSEPGYGYFAVARPPAGVKPRGLLMCFTGAEGVNWWAQTSQGRTAVLTRELLALGFTIVQLRWTETWHVSSPGDDCGVARLAFAPATMIDYIHKTYYLPLGIIPRPGEAGFCLTGNSGGASQISYALSHYGLDSIVDVLLPTGGPPHTALTKSSLLISGQEGYWMGDFTRDLFDQGFGIYNGNGPSLRHDSSFAARWDEASIAVGGSDYVHPTTRVHFIIGQLDRTGMLSTYKDYFDRLVAAGSPYVTDQIIAGMEHNISGSDAGMAALKAAILAPPPPAAPRASSAEARIVNLSIRTTAGTGAQTLILGFAVGGAGTTAGKPLLVRGIGPTLALFGVTGALADPRLQVLNGGDAVASNDDWGGSAPLASAFAQTGAFALPPASKDAALTAMFNNATYNAQVSGGDTATGIALAEIYDMSANVTAETPRLINVSARTQVGTGSEMLVAGFVIGGSGPKNVIIRAIGPTLESFGVAGALADPQLQLFQDGVAIRLNDNWGGDSALAAAFAQVGAFSLAAGSKDAALQITLQPGSYSAQVSGVGNTTGIALVEVYEAP